SSIFGTGALPDSLSVGRIAPAGSGAVAGAGQDILAAAKQNFSTDYLGSYFNAVADKARELATATGDVAGAAGKAADAWRGLRKTVGDTADKLQQRISNLGESIGGIFRGLLDQTMTWKDAALNAIQSVLTFLNQQNLDRGGAGLFGGGLFGAIAQGFLGFAGGGYTGPGGKYQPAGVVHKGEYVMSAAATQRIGVRNLDRLHRSAKGYAEGGYVAANNNHGFGGNDNGKIEVIYAPQIDASGADPAAIERLDQALARDRREFDAKVVGAIQNARSRRII
ncbi:MAG: hypothetical protein KAH44_11835, partial [Oricola sp.]|nr:hypothetical protein [Oricola sp.]